MSNQEKYNVAGIALRTDKHTNIALHRLYGWVIWQFPRLRNNGYLAAIRPPLVDQEWIPAIIRADRNQVKVYGNAGKKYATPEEAVEFFQENKKGSK